MRLPGQDPNPLNAHNVGLYTCSGPAEFVLFVINRSYDFGMLAHCVQNYAVKGLHPKAISWWKVPCLRYVEAHPIPLFSTRHSKEANMSRKDP
ncbi:hypothetical protein VTL71DRAFT_13194, partial [Oculimacula yallundae]